MHKPKDISNVSPQPFPSTQCRPARDCQRGISGCATRSPRTPGDHNGDDGDDDGDGDHKDDGHQYEVQEDDYDDEEETGDHLI